MGKWKNVFILAMILLFLFGLSLMWYPYLYGEYTKDRITEKAEDFLGQPDLPVFTRPDRNNTVTSTVPSVLEIHIKERAYAQLWKDMVSYNESLYRDAQNGLSSAEAYREPSFILADYGLENEAIGVLTIPVLSFEMPIYLGATEQHLLAGVAHLSQTSLPIGGSNTNTVIAGHRGWYGADYLRYIENLKIGDEVIVTNLWEELIYRVCEIKVIEPTQVEAILIQPNRELLTLLTCHPYATGGRQRYLVICERTQD